MTEKENALKALEGLMKGLDEAGTSGWYYVDYLVIKEFIEASKEA